MEQYGASNKWLLFLGVWCCGSIWNRPWNVGLNTLKYIKELLSPLWSTKNARIFEILAINTASRNKLPWYIDEEMHCYTAKIIGQYEITCQPQMTKNAINFNQIFTTYDPPAFPPLEPWSLRLTLCEGMYLYVVVKVATYSPCMSNPRSTQQDLRWFVRPILLGFPHLKPS